MIRDGPNMLANLMILTISVQIYMIRDEPKLTLTVFQKGKHKYTCLC